MLWDWLENTFTCVPYCESCHVIITEFWGTISAETIFKNIVSQFHFKKWILFQIKSNNSLVISIISTNQKMSAIYLSCINAFLFMQGSKGLPQWTMCQKRVRFLHYRKENVAKSLSSLDLYIIQ